jgi:hypothetical protein
MKQVSRRTIARRRAGGKPIAPRSPKEPIRSEHPLNLRGGDTGGAEEEAERAERLEGCQEGVLDGRQAPQPIERRLDGDPGIDPRGTRRTIDGRQRLFASVDERHRSPRTAREDRLEIGFGHDYPALEDPRLEEADDLELHQRPFVVREA